MNEHTPGPWTAKQVMSREEVAEAIWDGAEAEAGWWVTGPKFIDCEDSGLFFREADARLVAGAPVLLAALEALLADLRRPNGAHSYDRDIHQHDCRACRYRRTVRDAIDQARGAS